MVILGASGDLTSRKLMPALWALEKQSLLGDELAIIGIARSEMDSAGFRGRMRDAIGDEAKGELWGRFAGRLHYLSGSYDDQQLYGRLEKLLDENSCDGERVFYMALPPNVTERALTTMIACGLIGADTRGKDARVMVEKPFGLDLAGARRLNELLLSELNEPQIYRIDHYLAKETIRNLLVFRFANAIFEPLWDRKYIDSVQITATEEIGIEGRGGYYDQAGVVRDIVQNHVLQVLALIAMEAPLAGDVESTRDKKVDVFKSLAPVGDGDCVFGQYNGYRDEPSVAPGSCTPTFVALRFHINNLRWQGVPFYVRAGKALARKLTEIVIQFKTMPLCVLGDESLCSMVGPNQLTLRLQPDEGIRLSFSAKKPGMEDALGEANMDFRYADFGLDSTEAYDKVLLDGLEGRPALFWRADGIEAAWKAVEPLLHVNCDVPGGDGNFPNYEPGSWGPDGASELLAADGRRWLPTY